MLRLSAAESKMTKESRFARRKAHERTLRSGRVIAVGATWVSKRQSDKVASYQHKCFDCGATVVSVRMKRGGWVHFEGGEGLTSIKHPCFHRGEGLGKRRDADTTDLFEDAVEPRVVKQPSTERNE